MGLNKAVIFDFDGVIIDSLENQRVAYAESYQQVMGQLPERFEEFLSHSGDSLRNIFNAMKLPNEMFPAYKEISKKRINLIVLFPEVMELMEKLQKNRYKCALCTGKERERTLEVLKLMKLDSYFDAVICSDDVLNPKPHAESLVTAIKHLGVDSNHCIMIGDSKNDILCAKNAKVPSIAVGWGTSSKEVLLGAYPDYYAETFDKLYSCIEFHFTNSSFHKQFNNNSRNNILNSI